MSLFNIPIKVVVMSLAVLVNVCFMHSLLAKDLLADSEALATAYAKALKSELSTALRQGGHEKAINVCKQRAPEIAAELSRTSGAKVQRVSKRFRNPLNQPQDWQLPVLDWFENSNNEASSYFQDDSENPVRFMKVIKTDALCLSCHGASLSEEVQASLIEHYPNDLAKNYNLGEVRGAFSVEWPKGQEDALGIKNFRQIGDSLYVAGQPTLEQFTLLAKSGIETVISLRGENEVDFDEAKEVVDTGMRFINLTIKGASDITPENSRQLRTILDQIEGPVLLHCGSSNRVGALLAVDAAMRGYHSEAAMKYGKLAGMRGLTDITKEVIEALPLIDDSNQADQGGDK